IAVAEELHFGRAAEVLGISQPPLSQQIQALEQELGARLFERTNRRVELSEAGRLFLDEARLVLAQVEKASDVARRAQLGTGDGAFRVLSPDLWQRVVCPIVESGPGGGIQPDVHSRGGRGHDHHRPGGGGIGRDSAARVVPTHADRRRGVSNAARS
nr:hypothetical protein [Tanacetum cinerariifolium]